MQGVRIEAAESEGGRRGRENSGAKFLELVLALPRYLDVMVIYSHECDFSLDIVFQ
jgi:hypothetical protein